MSGYWAFAAEIGRQVAERLDEENRRRSTAAALGIDVDTFDKWIGE